MNNPQAPVEQPRSYSAISASTSSDCSPSEVPFGDFRLSSHFQPIYSLSLQRIVGHEALLRATDLAAKSISPPDLFRQLSSDQQCRLDCRAQQLHLANFLRLTKGEGWIFVNMTPEVFLHAMRAKCGHSFGQLLADLGIDPHRVVIELLEKDILDSTEFDHAIDYFRELGCLVALDDFGAGSSNFDRVWSLRPKIVKLDRNLIQQATTTTRVRRILPQLVSLLHEAGAMVLVEGIETVDEAYIALDANADFAQGYLFGRPAPTLADEDQTRAVIRSVWNAFDDHWKQDAAHQKSTMAPYVNAIGNASVLLSAGRSIEASFSDFLNLPDATICYLLDERGEQIGVNQWRDGVSAFPDPRLAPLRDTHKARWSRSPYFRRALGQFGKVQITRPYLSISSASLCVTVSVSFRREGRLQVICGDVNWNPDMLIHPLNRGQEC